MTLRVIYKIAMEVAIWAAVVSVIFFAWKMGGMMEPSPPDPSMVIENRDGSLTLSRAPAGYHWAAQIGAERARIVTSSASDGADKHWVHTKPGDTEVRLYFQEIENPTRTSKHITVPVRQPGA